MVDIELSLEWRRGLFFRYRERPDTYIETNVGDDFEKRMEQRTAQLNKDIALFNSSARVEKKEDIAS